jgi:integrase
MKREQLDALARRYLSARFDEIESALAVNTLGGSGAWRDASADQLEDRHGRLSACLAEGDYRDVSAIADKYAPDADPETRAKLSRRLVEAELEAIGAEVRALYGEPLVMPSLAPAAGVPAEEHKATPRLSEVVAQFIAHKLASKAWGSPRTETRNRGMLAELVDLLGDPRIGDVSKEDMRELQTTVPRIPRTVGKNPEWKELPLREVLAKVGDDPEVTRIDPGTVNMRLSIARSLWKWAIENDLCPGNGVGVAEVLKDLRTLPPEEQRDRLTPAEVGAFIAACDKAATRGDPVRRPVLQWVPRILALSGMRLGEAAQLRKRDVREVDGVAVFDLNREGDDKSLKTDTSVRLVPVHTRLIDLGFLQWVAEQRDGFLWHAKYRTAKVPGRSPTDRLSRLVNDPLHAAVPKVKTSAHSLRHTLEHELGRAGVHQRDIDGITGHKGQDQQQRRYRGYIEPATLLAALSKLVLPI